MRTRTISTTLASVLGFATFSFAASGAEFEGSGLLLVLFIGFGSIIIAFQFVPGIVMLYSMLKGIFSPSPAAKENNSSAGNR